MRLINPFPYPVDVPALGLKNLGASQATPEVEPSEITESLLAQGWADADAVDLPAETDGTGRELPPAVDGEATEREAPAVDERLAAVEVPLGEAGELLEDRKPRRRTTAKPGAPADTTEEG